MDQLSKFEVVNPIYDDKWNEQIVSLKGYSFFHTSQWADLISKSYGYDPIYHVLKNNGKLVAVFPLMEIKSVFTGNRGVSLPFSDFSNPLVENSFQFNQLFENIISLGTEKKWKFIELKGVDNFFSEIAPSHHEYKHIIHLDGNEDAIFSKFNNTTKRNIRKAAKEGVKVFQSDREEDLCKFFTLNAKTRKRHGLPPQPFSFFQNLYDIIIKQGLGILFIAEYQNKVIAGNVYLHIENQALYKFGASDFEYQNVRANNLIMWEAIKHYNSHGFKEFSFGKTEPNNDGLRRFKNGWSPVEIETYNFRYSLAENNFVSFGSQLKGFHNKVFENLPLPVLKICGSMLYKHFG